MIRNVVIVGAGIGAEHLRGYAQLPDRYQVKAVCDLNLERAQQAVASFPDVAAISSLDDVLSDSTVDIIDVCLPPHLHLSTCLKALDAGKIVVCEKPLVSSLADADILEAKVCETNGIVAPVFQYRYGLGTKQLRALIDAGLAGDFYAGSLETHWDRDAAYYAVDWRGTWAGEGGGPILGHAIHIHDLLTWIAGPVERVYMEGATRVNDVETEDCAALSIKMKNGGVVTSSVTLGAAGNMSRMRLTYQGFTVESDHAPYSLAAKGWTFKARAPLSQSAIDKVLQSVGSSQFGFAGMFEALAESLDGKGGAEVTLLDGRRSIEFVTACYYSTNTQTAVVMPLSPQHPYYLGWVPTS